MYRGTMQVRASLLGICLAHLCRLIGTPVAPFVHEQVPVVVRLEGTNVEEGRRLIAESGMNFTVADGCGADWSGSVLYRECTASEPASRSRAISR